MIDSLKAYPEMKDSGLPWLGKVPAHWELVPNRAILRRRKVVVGAKHETYQLLSLTKQGVIIRDVVNLRGKFSTDMGTSQEVRPGDLVFCLFDVPETPRTVGLSTHHGMITGAYTVFESLGRCSERFFELFYIAMDDRKLLGPLYSGLRNTIPPSVFLGVKTPLPSPDEQAAIVRFLDHADRRIRRYIHAKQKLVKLLEEHKQAIIHRAVTRGLDPSVPLKPSGVEWLGDVPEHWMLRRIRTCIELPVAGVWGEEPTNANSLDHVVCVRVADYDMNSLGLRTDKFTIRAISEAARTQRLLRKGDILVEKSGGGEAEPVGRAVLFDLDIEAVTSNFITRIRVNPRTVRSTFLLYVLNYLQGSRRNLLSITQTTGLQNLDEKHYLSTFFGLPPLAEQDSIIRRINADLTGTREAMARIQREVDLIREYRARLVADVVTGQLDVRPLDLPDTEEVEPSIIADIEEIAEDEEIEELLT